MMLPNFRAFGGNSAGTSVVYSSNPFRTESKAVLLDEWLLNGIMLMKEYSHVLAVLFHLTDLVLLVDAGRLTFPISCSSVQIECKARDELVFLIWSVKDEQRASHWSYAERLMRRASIWEPRDRTSELQRGRQSP